MHSSKFIVSHIAARRDYDVAAIMYHNNLLDKLFIDAYYSKEHLKLFKILDHILPKSVVKTYQRYQPSVPHEVINYDWLLGLKYKLALKANRRKDASKPIIAAYQQLAKNTLSYAKTTKNVTSYYGFDTSSVDFFEWAAPRGWFLVLEQCVAPRKTQICMHKLFQDAYSINQKTNIEQCLMLQEREEREWQLASVILCPSEYVKNELIKAGAPAEKIKVVPFGYDPKKDPKYIEEVIRNRFLKGQKKIKVLFAGNAGYRKGIFELLYIAKGLRDENLEFVIAGNIEKSCESLIKSSNLANVTFLGKLPISDLHEEYSNSDIFLFPSYLEGSAMVIFEAMSWGLPIITTYEAGSVINNGQEGYLCKAGDINMIKSSLLQLVYDDNLRLAMSNSARDTAQKFSLNYYSKNLIGAINK